MQIKGFEVVVISGPTGAGKSSTAVALATRLGVSVVDADDAHTPEAKAQMNSGIPLKDDQRVQWLIRLRDKISKGLKSGQPVVVACSALKEANRKQLAEGWSTLFVFLDITAEEAQKRFREREKGPNGHWLEFNLVPTQFEVWERPKDGFFVQAVLPLEEIVDKITNHLATLSG